MSSNQFLIIYKFPVLFNILNEIKYILNFKIEYFDSDQFKNNLNKGNSLIISGKKKTIHFFIY